MLHIQKSIDCTPDHFLPPDEFERTVVNLLSKIHMSEEQSPQVIKQLSTPPHSTHCFALQGLLGPLLPKRSSAPGAIPAARSCLQSSPVTLQGALPPLCQSQPLRFQQPPKPEFNRSHCRTPPHQLMASRQFLRVLRAALLTAGSPCEEKPQDASPGGWLPS